MAGQMDQVDSKKGIKKGEKSKTENWDPVKVAEVIYNAIGYDALHGWSILANHLDVHVGKDKLDLDTIQLSVIMGARTTLKALQDVLAAWQKKKGTDATIHALSKKLRELTWVNQAENLEAEFGISSNR